MKLNKFFTAVGVVTLMAGFTACNDDEVYTEGFEGVSGQVVLAPTVNESYKFVKIPTEMIAPNITLNVAPRSRVRATEDLTMKFAIDNSLVDEYNTANSTAFNALPDGVVTMDVDEATITEGNTSSEAPVTVKVTDDASKLAKLEVGKDYMVPVRMTEVTKGDARIAVSATNVSYLTFSVTEEMINQGGSPTGTIIPKADRTSWSATFGDGANEYMGANAWNNPIRETGSYNYGSYPAGSTVTFDLSKEYTFDGIYSYPYFGSSTYALFKANTEILISSDGSNWTSLGAINSLRTTVALYAPVTARYIKVIEGANGSVATTAFSIYEK
ncbi:MAG: DUF1735 domain-containing protein [Muribaculaceae bacterium]|nr:DUF1735 domain-containing protein [Muribaculaceae bacterium]